MAVGATLGAVAALLYGVISQHSPSATVHHPAPSFESFFLGFSSMLFSLGGGSNFPTIQHDMRHREKFSYSVVAAFTC